MQRAMLPGILGLIVLGAWAIQASAENTNSTAIPLTTVETAADEELPEAEQKVVLPALDLAIATKQEAVGYHFEGLEVSQIENLTKQAQTYVSYRRGDLSPKERLFAVAECISQQLSSEIGTKNLFCDFLLASKPDDSSSSSSRSQTRRLSSSELAERLGKGQLSELIGVREGHLHKALEHFSDWSGLEKISSRAMDYGSCQASPLWIALAQKAEEYFPEPSYREIATNFFKKAARCGEDGSKAKYRLSLLQVWGGKCEEAVPHLDFLASEKNGDYVSRALYWRGHCAKAAGNKLLTEVIKGKLLKDYPLSYHSLVLSGGRNREIARVLDTTEPVVTFRSQIRPDLNDRLRAIELLQKFKAHDLALEILKDIQPQLESTEISLRLYVTLLFGRSGDTIGQFQTLAGMFSEHSSAISRETLKLFYPLKQFHIMKRYAKRLDPLLVASLIRQESGFIPHARSPVGALGLMQLMPDTARRFERVSSKRLLNPYTNIRIGVKYFDQLLKRYSNDAELALAAYNAGPERVDVWKKRYTTEDRMLFFDLIPYRETRNYVVLIARNYYWYLNLYAEANPVNGAVKLVRGPASSRAPVVFTLFESI